MLHILCRMPLQAESITLPPLVATVMSATATTLNFTKQGLEIIGSLSSEFMTQINTAEQVQGEGEEEEGAHLDHDDSRERSVGDGPCDVPLD